MMRMTHTNESASALCHAYVDAMCVTFKQDLDREELARGVMRFVHEVFDRRTRDDCAGVGAKPHQPARWTDHGQDLETMVHQAVATPIIASEDPWVQQWLPGMRRQPFLYHVSPSSNRESILQHGLRAAASPIGASRNERGVYLEPDADTAYNDWGPIGDMPPADIWRVPNSEFADTLQYDAVGEALYTPHGVKAELYRPGGAEPHVQAVTAPASAFNEGDQVVYQHGLLGKLDATVTRVRGDWPRQKIDVSYRTPEPGTPDDGGVLMEAYKG